MRCYKWICSYVLVTNDHTIWQRRTKICFAGANCWEPLILQVKVETWPTYAPALQLTRPSNKGCWRSSNDETEFHLEQLALGEAACATYIYIYIYTYIYIYIYVYIYISLSLYIYNLLSRYRLLEASYSSHSHSQSRNMTTKCSATAIDKSFQGRLLKKLWWWDRVPSRATATRGSCMC